MTNEEAIKYLRQLYPQGGCCWLDEQRMEAISIAIEALSQSVSDQEEHIDVEAIIEESNQAQADVVEVKILHLPLKAKWFNMQESGEKTEEYREIIPYWCKRLLGRETALLSYRNNYQSCNVKGYTHVLLRYGYTQRCIVNRIDSITIGRGNPEWGAPTDRDVFIIKHHKEDVVADGWRLQCSKESRLY